MKKSVFLSFFLILYFLATPLSGYAEEFEIKHADNLEADKQQISIKGNILIKYKDALIEAPEGKVETDEDGKPTTAIFTGRAKIKLKDRKIEADKIKIVLTDQSIKAEGNVISELKDKKSNPITIASDSQDLYWNGEDANANGNIRTTYGDTIISSDTAKVVYKNKKPYQAFFTGEKRKANLEQPNNLISAKQFIFDINTQDIKAESDVKGIIWPHKEKTKEEQQPINITSDELFINQADSTITAKSAPPRLINLSYEGTIGRSNEGVLLREKSTGKPKKLIFKGNADVKQEDKQLTSEEIVFNIEEKKLFSNTKDNTRPKTTFFKKAVSKQ